MPTQPTPLNKQTLQYRILKLMLDYPRAPILARIVAYKLNASMLDSANALSDLHNSGLIIYNADLCHYHITSKGKEALASLIKQTPTTTPTKGTAMPKTQTKTALGTPVTRRRVQLLNKDRVLRALYRLSRPSTAREVRAELGEGTINSVLVLLGSCKNLGFVSAEKIKGTFTRFSLTDKGIEYIAPLYAPNPLTAPTPTPTPPEPAPTLQDLAAAALAPAKQKLASNLIQVLVQKTETYTMKLIADAPAIHITKEQYDLIKDTAPLTGTASVSAETTYSLATLDGKLVALTREQYEQLTA